MDKQFNTEALEQLIQKSKEDAEALDIIYEVLHDFEEYHARIIEMETKLHLFSSETMEREEYQQTVTRLDRNRTMQHESVLTGVNVLNRMAAACGVEPVYDGIVSKERPYRREVANAVLGYLEDVIQNRR